MMEWTVEWTGLQWAWLYEWIMNDDHYRCIIPFKGIISPLTLINPLRISLAENSLSRNTRLTHKYGVGD